MSTTSRTEARGALPDDLRADVRLLGDALGTILREYGGQELLDDVERLRAAVIAAVDDPASSLTAAEQIVADLAPARAIEVARAFTVYFHLVNLAEEAYRIRILTERDDPAFEQTMPADNSLARAYAHAREEVGAERADELLRGLQFYPVLTAHPTEARRRAVTRPIRALVALVNESYLANPSPRRKLALAQDIAREVETLWLTAQLRPTKPSPLDEVKTALDAATTTIYPALTDSLHRFYDSLTSWGIKAPQIDPFVRLGSWIGGDRDGNPFVHAATTRAAARAAHESVLDLLAAEAERVGRSLTQDARHIAPSEDLLSLIGDLRQHDEDTFERISRDAPGEPHRQAVLFIAARLRATASRHADLAYASPDDAERELTCVHDSLVAGGAVHASAGPLQDLLWRIRAVGFHFAALEVRQHSKVHRQTLAWIADDTAETTIDPTEVLATFDALAVLQRRYGDRAAGRYIVSFTQSADDIANVYRLAKHAAAGARGPVLDVVPLFETFDDLQAAPRILAEMIELDDVAQRLATNGRRLEVMLGYSDSAKDVGPVAATLALYEAQTKIAAWADANDIRLTLFHGRGGALGRGGGPAQRAIMSQPPHSVSGRFKVTEQGEVIQARYGEREIAARHIDQVAAATLLSSLPSHEQRLERSAETYRKLAATLDRASRDAFFDLVGTPEFPQWFATVTPQEEVGWLALGSRPAKRGLSVQSLDDLRAIPWVFAWTQARINLTGWYGLGSALQAVGDVEALRAAYRDWPLFTTLIDNVEMSLAKTDRRISAKYLALDDNEELAGKVEAEYDRTYRWVLDIVQHEELLAGHRVLGRAVHMRNPYVDALSLLQLRALKQVRDGSADDMERRLLMITIKGVAAGLQNTG